MTYGKLFKHIDETAGRAGVSYADGRCQDDGRRDRCGNGGGAQIQPPNEHFFRKVDIKNTFKKTWKILGLYFTISNCRVKKRISCGYSRKGHDGKLILKVKTRLFKEHDERCPHCGRKFDFEAMEIHHVLPYARFQDLLNDERNMIFLCHECHKEIHCNPYRNIRLMEQKAAELGIDLNERYDKNGL